MVSVAASALSLRLFPKAFPLVSLDIRMDRAHAIQAARTLSAEQKWGPRDSVRDAASFGGDGAAQSFIELEGGGKDAFAALLHDDLFAPYTWQVRLFKESETNRTTVLFKPSGTPYGFEELLRENAPGAALSAEHARPIAETAVAAAPWNLPLARFRLVESSQVTRPGGRIDHTFIYERPDRQLGEGRLRLRLVVSGDRLTAMAQFVKVPEAFTRRYEQMRSANNAIAGGASIGMVLLYIVGGCGVGFFFLLRQRAVLWRAPLVWAAAIAVLQLLASINAWPLTWLGYDTAVAVSSFTTERILTLVAGALLMGFVVFVSFLAAEGLTRRAFPRHPQLWRIWSTEAAPTKAILGRTLAGYLLAACSLVYVLAFYYVAFRRLGWWSPSDALVDPNLLAHYWPWLTPLATAAQAGFWEETLFRAVPLAGAALLGARWGGRRWWIAGAFVLQALVFAAAHANYPGQPAYSRLVELLVPSFIFGGLYLSFGLLPAILLHFTYDVVLMSLPLFAASVPGIWIDRTLLVLVSLVPLWVVLWRRWRAGRWHELPASLRNGAWTPPRETAVVETPVIAPVAAAVASLRFRVLVLALALAGLAAWKVATPLELFGPSLRTSRVQAIQIARAELTRRGITPPATFRADASVAGRPDDADRYVWQTAGRETYASLIGRYLPEYRWHVRFATFQGDVAERAEQWSVVVTGDGRAPRVEHQVPEARTGATPTETEARARVHRALHEIWHLDAATLKEVSATSAKRPHRLDWTFVFKDPTLKSISPGEGRLQVELAGDEVSDAFRFVFVPEDWQRADRALAASYRIGGIVKGVAVALLVLAGIVAAVIAWSRKKFNVRVALVVFVAVFAAGVASGVLQWPATAARFGTAQPLQLQQMMTIIALVFGGLIGSAGIALLAGLAVRWLPAPLPHPRDTFIVGTGSAAVMLAGSALAALLAGQAGPNWLPVGSAGTYVPWLVPAFGAIAGVATQSSVILLLAGAFERMTAGWQRRRGVGFALAYVTSLLLSLFGGGTSVTGWLAASMAGALAMTLVYLFVLRRDLTAVPFACGVAGTVQTLIPGLLGAHAGGPAAAALASIVFLSFGSWATFMLRRLSASGAPLATPYVDPLPPPLVIARSAATKQSS